MSKYTIQLYNYGEVADVYEYDDIKKAASTYWYYHQCDWLYTELLVDGVAIQGRKNVVDVLGSPGKVGITIPPKFS